MKLALLARLTAPLALLLAVACGSGDDPTGTGGSGATGTGGSGTTATGAGGSDTTTGTGGSGTTTTGTGGSMADSLTLHGDVSRTAAIPQGLDGVGDLYVAVFDKNPILDQGAAPLGNQLIPAADLSDPAAKVPYQIADLPYTPDATLYMVAFLDDDGNASMQASPGPKKPDLVTLEGIGPVTVKVTMADQKVDLVLNAEMPF